VPASAALLTPLLLLLLQSIHSLHSIDSGIVAIQWLSEQTEW